MTSPDNAVPTVAYTKSTVHNLQDVDQATLAGQKNADLRGWAEGARGNLFSGLLGGFLNIPTLLSDIASAFTGGGSFGLGPLLTIKNQAIAQQQAAQVVANKVESLLTGGTRQTFASSGTWTNPGPGRIVGIACIQGGWGGLSVSSNDRSVGGRYVYAEFKSDDLPATVAVTVGAGGSGSVGGGSRSTPGTSSFGTFVKADGSGSGILSSQGIIVTDSNAGYGGLGESDTADPARTIADQSGTGNALAAGGAYLDTNPGTAGGAAPTNQIAVAGGGGGSGGEQLGALGVSTGGAGGWPGGAGGNGGKIGLGGSSNGGQGAPGAVFVTVKG